MEESKKDKYKKFQIKKKTNAPKKGNTLYTEPYDHNLGNFDASVQKKRKGLVEGGSSKHKNDHAGRTVREDHSSMKTGKPVVKKYSAGEGSGSIPSGTNTHIDKAKWGRRADGSSGPL